MKKIVIPTETKGKKLYCGISGGKDSIATALSLKDAGIDFTPFFVDTGWEHPDQDT